MTIHISGTLLIQHLLFAFLVIVAPLWDYLDTARLKQSAESARKIGYYKTLCSWLWLAALVAVAIVGFRAVFTIAPAPDEASWLFEHMWVRYLFVVLFSVFLALVLLPAAIGLWKNVTKQPRKYTSAELLKSLDFILPHTWSERRWYAFLCITAGVCEEVLFRGFLLHYLHQSPWMLNLTLALFLSSVIFGLQHLYLGTAGAVQAFVMGFIFGLLFLLTGSLIAPMVFHALSDLRMLVILRPPER